MVIWDRDFGFGSDAFGELERLSHRMNRLFGSALTSRTYSSFPPVNIWCNNEKVVVSAEVPGLEKEDIDLSVENDVLTIKGHRQPEKIGEDEAYRRHERGHGAFRRAIGLPFAVDPDQVTADYSDGILRIELTRHEASKPKRIEVR